MSTAVEINGVTLVPIKEAASSVSYSRDYVARLAREGKIVASQIGRQWFVDLVSLQNFSTEAGALEEVRKSELSAERKRELMAKDCLKELDVVVAQKIRRQRFDAVAVAMAVLCLGLFAGAGVYTVSLFPNSKLASLTESLSSDSASLPKVALVATHDEGVLRQVTKPEDTLLLTTVMERPVFVSESEVRSLGEMAEGIMVLARETKLKNAGDVANLFSDEVAVTFTDDVSGVIKYDQGEGKILEYPFVAVPTIHEQESEVTKSTP